MKSDTPLAAVSLRQRDVRDVLFAVSMSGQEVVDAIDDEGGILVFAPA